MDLVKEIGERADRCVRPWEGVETRLDLFGCPYGFILLSLTLYMSVYPWGRNEDEKLDAVKGTQRED